MTHDYLSTACLHDLHGRCRRDCKFCGVACRCQCHAPCRSCGAGDGDPCASWCDYSGDLSGLDDCR